MEKTIEDLKLEADELGITYVKNIGVAKLQEKIDAHYEADSAASIVEQITEEVEQTEAEFKKSKKDARVEALRVIKAQEKENSESVVVKLTLVDKRESSTATEAYLSNGDFGMRVPLDVFVEMPKILAILADSKVVPIHKEVNGKTVVSMTKQYVVEYKR